MKFPPLKKKLFLFTAVVLTMLNPLLTSGQLPTPALVGYFHNWQDASAPYIQLNQVDPRYNVIDVAFAVPIPGTDYNMQFSPDQVSASVFISQIQSLKAQGKKVLISVGGANAAVSLSNIMERDTFISTMTAIINTYGFDGVDLDLEGSSLYLTGGTIASPVDASIVNLVYAVKQIMSNFFAVNGHKMMLTMAPETAFVQGGQSAYAGIWGAYLPVIDALRDSLDLLHVQLYNSGSMYGVDGGIYYQGTADFIVAMCDAVIHGFNTNGGAFTGLPAQKVAVGLPACQMAAGGGYSNVDTVLAAINYLRGAGAKPGNYLLSSPNGYPNFGGMMTWSINWDATANCGANYEYAQNFEDIFGATTAIDCSSIKGDRIAVFPNPAMDVVFIRVNEKIETPIQLEIFNAMLELVETKVINNSRETICLTSYPPGVYLLYYESSVVKLIKY